MGIYFLLCYKAFLYYITIPAPWKDGYNRRLLRWIRLLGDTSVINQPQQAFITLYTIEQERLTLKNT